MNDIYVRPFRIAKLDDGPSVVYSALGGAVVSQHEMVSALQELEQYAGSMTTVDSISSIIDGHNLNNQSALDFLQKDIKLLQTHDKRKGINRIHIYSDNDEVCDRFLEEIAVNSNVAVSKFEEESIEHEDFIVFFSEHYDSTKIRELYEICEKNDPFVLTASVIRRHLIIDPPFKRAKGLPCHFCRVAHLDVDASDPVSVFRDGWFSFQRWIKIKKPNAVASLQVSNIERGLATFWLCRRTLELASPHGLSISHDRFLESISISLETGCVTKEVIAHWPLCDCINQ